MILQGSILTHLLPVAVCQRGGTALWRWLLAPY